MIKYARIILIVGFVNFAQNTMIAQDSPYTKDYIMGKFDPSTHPDFTLIPSQLCDKPMYLRKDVLSAFKKMHAQAKKEGVNLTIISATRNFDYQKGIWERKWANLSKTISNEVDRSLEILTYSSMPSTSRHHWGTDIDLNQLSNAYFDDGEGKKIYDWLQRNGTTFGFVQVYTAKGPERPHGYNEERWHYSYAPISCDIIEQAAKVLTNEGISGFNGANTASKIDVVTKYVMGVSKACFK